MTEKFVLDCSVAAKWVIPEPDRAPALEWFERHASGEVLLIAPDLLLAELASLVAKRNRRKEISTEQAHEAFRLMTKCAPRLFDMRPHLLRALDLSPIPIILMGLRLPRPCVGTRVSGSYRRPPALPGREGQTPFRAPGSITNRDCR